MEKICKHHGLTEFKQTPKGKTYCPKCNVESVDRRRKRVRQILIDEFGGECQICGYNKNIGALHFHHVDPSTKEFDISLNKNVAALNRLREEAKKCVLLCIRCHLEVELGITNLGSL